MAGRDDDPQVVADQLYKAIRRKHPGVLKAEIGGIVADVRPLTTIQGASTLEVDVIDPDWVLITSGFLDKGADEKFDVVDLNYPQGSKMWWRLTQADVSTDLAGANLTLIFEDRAVSYCRGKTGEKSWSRAEYTRAQAIKAMTVDEVKAPPKLEFVSPELEERQTILVPGD
jgi:hypothetical protein